MGKQKIISILSQNKEQWNPTPLKPWLPGVGKDG